MVENIFDQLGQKKLFQKSSFELTFDFVIISSDVASGKISKDKLNKIAEDAQKKLEADAKKKGAEAMEEKKEKPDLNNIQGDLKTLQILL